MEKGNQEEVLRPRTKWGESRIIFYVHFKEIQDLVSLRWSLKKIHKHLFGEGQQLSYGQLHYHQIRATQPRKKSSQTVQQGTAITLRDTTFNIPKPELPKKQWEGGIRSFKKGPSNPDPRDVW